VLVDAARDGFLDGGFLEVSVNGELVGSVSGNFGESATIDFGTPDGDSGANFVGGSNSDARRCCWTPAIVFFCGIIYLFV
jgi:hypothetical protein